jgi:hypothetical protein
LLPQLNKKTLLGTQSSVWQLLILIIRTVKKIGDRLFVLSELVFMPFVEYCVENWELFTIRIQNTGNIFIN